MNDTLIDVRNLTTCFDTRDGVVRAVDDISLTIRRGETLALLGESGCGKSMTAFSLMRLVPAPAGRIAAGQVLLDGKAEHVAIKVPHPGYSRSRYAPDTR